MQRQGGGVGVVSAELKPYDSCSLCDNHTNTYGTYELSKIIIGESHVIIFVKLVILQTHTTLSFAHQ